MKKLMGCVMLSVMLLSGCASLETADGREFRTLGIASIKECEEFEGREDLMVRRCTVVTTDAFSGWEAITDGLTKSILKILTLGMGPF